MSATTRMTYVRIDAHAIVLKVMQVGVPLHQFDGRPFSEAQAALSADGWQEVGRFPVRNAPEQTQIAFQQTT